MQDTACSVKQNVLPTVQLAYASTRWPAAQDVHSCQNAAVVDVKSSQVGRTVGVCEPIACKTAQAQNQGVGRGKYDGWRCEQNTNLPPWAHWSAFVRYESSKQTLSGATNGDAG
jgi:hypothetical protein